MHQPVFTILLFASALLSACHTREVGQTNSVKMIEAPNTEPEIKDIIIDPKLDAANLGGSGTSIDSISVKGDILSIFATYGGGCKKHIFDLYSTGIYAKSLPPQLTIYLKHVNNDDRCKKLVIQELKFNIAAVKYKRGSLIIKLGDSSVKYQ